MFFLDDALIYQMNHIDKYVYIWMSLNSNRHAYVHICKLINLYLKLLLKISDLHLMFRIIFTSKKYKKIRVSILEKRGARSFETAIYGTFIRRMHIDVRNYFDKNHDERAWCRS